MKLYKFRTVDTYSLSALSNNKLWFSTLGDFNDPFEGAHILDNYLSEDDFSLIKEIVGWKPKEEVGVEAYEQMLTKMGVQEDDLTDEELFATLAVHDLNVLVKIIHSSKIVCMSLCDEEKDPIKENLMWSHYSNGLRGFCLVFDSESLQVDINNSSQQAMRAIQVEYQDEPNVLKLSEFVKSKNILKATDNDYMQSITETIATKSSEWAYENEIRILALGETNLHAYSPSTLLEIVIGEKMPQDQKKLVMDTAKKANPNIVISQASLMPNSYQLEISELKKQF